MRDTRESGEMLEASLAAGVAAGGGHALLGGVLPTPGAALLVAPSRVRPGGGGLGLAQPLPGQRDQVLRPRRHEGLRRARRRASRPSVTGDEQLPERPIGRVRELHGAGGDYLRELELRFRDLDLSGRRVLLDCANGATYRVAPEIFRRLGADVEALAVAPDGRNINDGVRLDARGGAGRAGRGGRLRRRLRLRRRRRPRAGGGPQRRGGGRRRAAGARGAAPARGRAACPARAWRSR